MRTAAAFGLAIAPGQVEVRRAHKPSLLIAQLGLVKRLSRIITASLVASAMVSCASSNGREVTDTSRTMARTVEALKAQSDPDSLAAAAITPLNSLTDAERFALLSRSAALAPDRPDVRWLQLAACGRVEECDPAPLAATLHRLDPENGAAWLFSLNRAVKAGDRATVNKTLAAIADSKRFDMYWNPSIAHLGVALAKVHTVDLPTALSAAIGGEGMFSIPAYQDISKACRPPDLAESGRIEICRRIAGVLRSGDTYVAEMVGVAIAQKVWDEGSPEFAGAVAARRVAQYRMHTAGTIENSWLRREAGARRYLALLAAHRAEQDLALAAIAEARQSPDPPSHWSEALLSGS